MVLAARTNFVAESSVLLLHEVHDYTIDVNFSGAKRFFEPQQLLVLERLVTVMICLWVTGRCAGPTGTNRDQPAFLQYALRLWFHVDFLL